MATRALNGAHVLVLEGLTIAPSIVSTTTAWRRRGVREIDWKRKLGLQSQLMQFWGRQGRMNPAAFDEGHVQGMSNNPRLQLRNAYTTTEKIVGSRQPKESNKRRLILLRHAKSSWADRSLKAFKSVKIVGVTSMTNSFNYRARTSLIMGYPPLVVSWKPVRVNRSNWPKVATSIPTGVEINHIRGFKEDHNRPLSKKGRLAAANIASKLEKHSWMPELILCSDSQRTRETLEIMQAHYGDLTDAEVRFLGSFYSVAAMDGQTAQHIQENVLKFTRDDVTTIMCMGHNRGWEEAASQLCGVAVELKTANAALLEAPGGSWKEAFEKAGMGGWRLVGIMKPDSTSDVEYEVA